MERLFLLRLFVSQVDLVLTIIDHFLVARTKPFILGVYTDTTTALTSPTTGFNLDYTQVNNTNHSFQPLLFSFQVPC